MQASSNNLPTFYQLWKNPALIRFSIQNIKFTSTVPIHYIYGETSGVYKSNMDFYYLGKLNQDCLGLLSKHVMDSGKHATAVVKCDFLDKRFSNVADSRIKMYKGRNHL